MSREDPSWRAAEPWRLRAAHCLDNKTKPPGSLGRLESLAIELAGVQRSLEPRVDPAQLIVFAADHGVTEEGVSAYPQAVTAEMMGNFARGGAAVSVLAKVAGIPVEVVDVGVASVLPDAGGQGACNPDAASTSTAHLGAELEQPSAASIVHAKVAMGTRNLLREAAMRSDECRDAQEVGRDAVRRAVTRGCRCVALGEMGIGNTTVAAILTGLLTGQAAEQVTGIGTGVDGDALTNKQAIVQAVIQRLQQPGVSPADWLQDAGGLEIAALVGAMHEAVDHDLPVLVDGYIVTAAALMACRLMPACRGNLFFSHHSAEPGHAHALATLEADPLLALGLRLGEGSGAALALPLLRAACHLLSDMASFESAGVSTAHDGSTG